MEMHQIRYFLAAARELNFTKAAAACSVSTPSLLRAIGLLEREFGGPLFNRERGNMHLTELGRIALPHLERIFDEQDEVKRKASTLNSSEKAMLSVGMMCTIAPDHFVPLVHGFVSQHPSITLQIVDRDAVSLQASLLAGDLDVAIFAMPGDEMHEKLHYMGLFAEQMVIAVCTGHALAGQERISVRDLDGLPYLERRNCEFGAYADKEFEAAGVRGETIYQSERDDWILAMIASGLGYGFMPASTARFAGVASRPLVEPEMWRTVNLVTVRGRKHGTALGAFLREVMRTSWLGAPPPRSRVEIPDRFSDEELS